LTPNLADPGLDPGRVYEKISVVKTRLALRVDPVKKTDCKSVNYFLFLPKRHHFDL
jgi:hypothetical protein